MKFLISISIIFSLFFSCNYAQKAGNKRLQGSWMGKIKSNAIELRVVFNFKQSGDSLKATLDSPDQGAKDIPVNKGWINGDSVFITASLLNGKYKGLMQVGDSTIEGLWTQGSYSSALSLHLLAGTLVIRRPQEPHEPFPYKSEDIVFSNKTARIELAGTLTIPEGKGPFAAVVLVTESGPQNRNEELLGHKPFLVLSDFLTRNGIAVLRYDDRGTNKSKGNFARSTTFDFADDAEAAFNYLLTRNEINHDKIGIAGHSEGGMIAPVIAARNKKVRFIILLAGPGLTGREILLRQTALISKAYGMSDGKIDSANAINNKIYEVLEKEPDSLIASRKIKQIISEEYEGYSKEEKQHETIEAEQTIRQVNTRWLRTFLRFDPSIYLSKVQCPVLALNGANDLQVPPDEDLNAILDIMEKTGNKFYQINKLPELNHLFQHSKTGLPAEYNQIEETFAPEAMQVIVDWLKKITD
jgi:hypothetical protein